MKNFIIFAVLSFTASAFACVMPGVPCSSVTDMCCESGAWCGSNLYCHTSVSLESVGLLLNPDSASSYTCQTSQKTLILEYSQN